MKKRAVILFNLGGPDRLESVRPFLRNLFNDRAIINLPAVLRYLISWIISYSRDKEAQKIYKKIKDKMIKQLEKINYDKPNIFIAKI